MKFLQKLWKLFLYGGIEKEEYNDLLPRIRRENTILLRVFSMIAAAMFFMLFITSMISGGFASVNTSTYLLSAVEMIIIMICARSFGIAVHEKQAQSELDMRDLVSAAEKDMFASKREFYLQSGNDRRNR